MARFGGADRQAPRRGSMAAFAIGEGWQVKVVDNTTLTADSPAVLLRAAAFGLPLRPIPNSNSTRRPFSGASRIAAIEKRVQLVVLFGDEQGSPNPFIGK